MWDQLYNFGGLLGWPSMKDIGTFFDVGGERAAESRRRQQQAHAERQRISNAQAEDDYRQGYIGEVVPGSSGAVGGQFPVGIGFDGFRPLEGIPSRWHKVPPGQSINTEYGLIPMRGIQTEIKKKKKKKKKK